MTDNKINHYMQDIEPHGTEKLNNEIYDSILGETNKQNKQLSKPYNEDDVN